MKCNEHSKRHFFYYAVKLPLHYFACKAELLYKHYRLYPRSFLISDQWSHSDRLSQRHADEQLGVKSAFVLQRGRNRHFETMTDQLCYNCALICLLESFVTDMIYAQSSPLLPTTTFITSEAPIPTPSTLQQHGHANSQSSLSFIGFGTKRNGEFWKTSTASTIFIPSASLMMNDAV